MRRGATGSGLIRHRGVRSRHQVTALPAVRILPASPASTYVLCSLNRHDRMHRLCLRHGRHDHDRRNRQRDEERRRCFLRPVLHQVHHRDEVNHPDGEHHRALGALRLNPAADEQLDVEYYRVSDGCREARHRLFRLHCLQGEEDVECPCPGLLQRGCCRGEGRRASVPAYRQAWVHQALPQRELQQRQAYRQASAQVRRALPQQASQRWVLPQQASQ